MELDEWTFAALKAINEKWTAYASDSESNSNSQAESEKGVVIGEMNEKIAHQNELIADQRNEIENLRSQQEEIILQMKEMKERSHEDALLREILQKLQDMHAPLASAATERLLQYAANESLSTHTAESEDVCSDTVAGKGESMNQMMVMEENSRQQ